MRSGCEQLAGRRSLLPNAAGPQLDPVTKWPGFLWHPGRSITVGECLDPSVKKPAVGLRECEPLAGGSIERTVKEERQNQTKEGGDGRPPRSAGGEHPEQ